MKDYDRELIVDSETMQYDDFKSRIISSGLYDIVNNVNGPIAYGLGKFYNPEGWVDEPKLDDDTKPLVIIEECDIS